MRGTPCDADVATFETMDQQLGSNSSACRPLRRRGPLQLLDRPDDCPPGRGSIDVPLRQQFIGPQADMLTCVGTDRALWRQAVFRGPLEALAIFALLLYGPSALHG